jgi:hypothetical protein
MSSDGAVTSASVKHRRYCAHLTNGLGGGCAPSPGSSGSADLLALLNCDAAASAGTERLEPPAAHMAHGGSATAPRSPSLCQTPSSAPSAWLPSWHRNPHDPSNRRIRTRMSGGVGGAASRDAPLSRLMYLLRVVLAPACACYVIPAAVTCARHPEVPERSEGLEGRRPGPIILRGPRMLVQVARCIV